MVALLLRTCCRATLRCHVCGWRLTCLRLTLCSQHERECIERQWPSSFGRVLRARRASFVLLWRCVQRSSRQSLFAVAVARRCRLLSRASHSLQWQWLRQLLAHKPPPSLCAQSTTVHARFCRPETLLVCAERELWCVLSERAAVASAMAAAAVVQFGCSAVSSQEQEQCSQQPAASRSSIISSMPGSPSVASISIHSSFNSSIHILHIQVLGSVFRAPDPGFHCFRGPDPGLGSKPRIRASVPGPGTEARIRAYARIRAGSGQGAGSGPETGPDPGPGSLQCVAAH